MEKKLVEKHYNRNYFTKRDSLDLLLAGCVEILMKEKKLKKVLDVGCGTGKLVAYLNKKGFDAFGCDKFDLAVGMAKKANIKGKIKKTGATNLAYGKNSFDLVLSISVIEHLRPIEAEKFLQEAKKVLKPGGYVFIITPNYASPFRYLFGKKWFGFSDPTHINFFTPGSIRSLLMKHGFEDIKFRFRSAYNVPFDWYLPQPLRKLPMPFKNLFNYLLISSPLSTFRDSIWVGAKCKK